MFKEFNYKNLLFFNFYFTNYPHVEPLPVKAWKLFDCDELLDELFKFDEAPPKFPLAEVLLTLPKVC